MRKVCFEKKKKGSSSIMVMMVMIVLVIFGVLALMSSYSDFKLAKKNSVWVSRYYKLDEEGENLVAEISKAVQQTQAEAENANKQSISNYSELIKSKILSIKTDSTIQISEKGKLVVADCRIGKKDENKLSVKVEIDLSKFLGSKNLIKPYRIIEWKQMPSEFKYNNVNQLWNGEVSKP